MQFIFNNSSYSFQHSVNKDNFFKMSSNKRKAASKSKSKAKKEARRMEKMKEAERKSNIQRANWINGDENSPRNVLDTNSLKADSPFRNYIKNDLSVHISFASPSDLSDADFACLYDITRTNMLEHYNRAAEVDPTDVRYFKKDFIVFVFDVFKKAAFIHPCSLLVYCVFFVLFLFYLLVLFHSMLYNSGRGMKRKKWKNLNIPMPDI